MYLSENMAILTMSVSIGIGMFLVINSMILTFMTQILLAAIRHHHKSAT